MAAKMPSFITGANAKIKVGGKTFAYASDVSYQVSVDTIPIETMGRYEAVSNEPVNYSVAGELSVVRYTAIANQNGMPGTNSTGNGLGEVNYTTGGNGGTAQVTDAVQFITIADCRFNRKSAALNKRGILVDRLSFVGILASDDSFEASNSGDTDLS